MPKCRNEFVLSHLIQPRQSRTDYLRLRERNYCQELFTEIKREGR